MYKQIIIVRKDLNMSYGKMAAQVSHGSMAFLITELRRMAQPLCKRCFKAWDAPDEVDDGEIVSYESTILLDKNIYEQWINGAFTKCVLQARNKNHLLKAKQIAEELGMKEGIDFFLIRDNCYTELQPEDEDGKTLTCIGFRPMDAETIDKVGKKYHLYM